MSIFKCSVGQKYTIAGIIEYITQSEKSEPEYVFTTGTDIKHVVSDATFIQIMFRDRKLSHKEYHQFISVLSPTDISPTGLDRFCQYIAALHYTLSRWPDLPQPEFQIITAIHFDKAPIYHAHTIVFTPSVKDGHSFPWDKKHFWLLMNLVNRLFLYYGFTPIQDKRLNELSTIPNFFNGIVPASLSITP